VTIQSRRNARIRSTERSALNPDSSTWADDELFADAPERPAPLPLSSRGFASMALVPPRAGIR
jgi:hypothetical protein